MKNFQDNLSHYQSVKSGNKGVKPCCGCGMDEDRQIMKQFSVGMEHETDEETEDDD